MINGSERKAYLGFTPLYSSMNVVCDEITTTSSTTKTNYFEIFVLVKFV